MEVRVEWKYKANSAWASHITVWEQNFNRKGMTGDKLHEGNERGPSWQGWRQKDDIKTQYGFNSTTKSKPRQVCLAVETSRDHLSYLRGLTVWIRCVGM